jgi:hypothetical protein
MMGMRDNGWSGGVTTCVMLIQSLKIWGNVRSSGDLTVAGHIPASIIFFSSPACRRAKFAMFSVV